MQGFSSNHYATSWPIYLWLVLVVLLRVILLLFAGYPLYQDEGEQFVCNTIQPGCSSVCHDVFAPISLLRFWLLQTLSLCLPFAAFVLFVVHKALSGLAPENSTSSGTASCCTTKKSGDSTAERSGGQPWLFTFVYILQLLVQIILEVGFAVSHYFLFGFYVPKSFLCHEVPCTSMVQCYISKPTEKTVMLRFMLAVSALCLMLNVTDAMCAVTWSARTRTEAKRETSDSYSTEGASVCLDMPNPLPDAQPLPSPESSRPDPSSAQEEGMERDGSQVALCHNNLSRALQHSPSDRLSHLKPAPPPKAMWGLEQKTSSSKLFSTRRMDQQPLQEAAESQQSDSSGTLERRAWV
ncbi:gap junction delta-4 protein-like [Arapaima gigas]